MAVVGCREIFAAGRTVSRHRREGNGGRASHRGNIVRFSLFRQSERFAGAPMPVSACKYARDHTLMHECNAS